VADRLISQRGAGASIEAQYNANDELTSDGENQQEYDATGNRSGQVGPGNGILDDGVWSYTYDNEGNRVGRTKLDGSESWSYQYDHLNHLTRVEKFDGTGTRLLRVVEFPKENGQLS
jgi:YD repeat-containing protein